MLRRVSISAAPAALTVSVTALLMALLMPVLMAAPAVADHGGTPSDDPAAQAQVRKQQPRPTPRKPVVSRRANRVEAKDDSPLSVTIDQLTPSTIPTSGLIHVSGFVTNNDTETWSTINVRAFISATPLTTPEQLAEAAALPPDAVVGARIDNEQHKGFIAELAPGEQAPYSFTIPRGLLHVSTPGVYWFGVHALGEGPDGRDDTADGRARTFLPLVPEARPGQEATAVVIPIRHSLEFSDDGSVADLADWTKTLAPGGRLRSLVDFGASSGDRTVTWVVDPAVIDAVRRIAEGNPPRSLAANLKAGQDDGEDGDATGDPSAPPSSTDQPTGDPTKEPTAAATSGPEATSDNPLDLNDLDPVVRAAAEAAQAWLNRLTAAMRPEDQVMTLPYGDVDVAAAAVHDPQLYQRAVTRSGTLLPGYDGTTTPVIASPSGYLNRQGIEAAAPGSTILLTDAMFRDSAPSLATTEGRDVVVASTGAAAGGPGPDSRTSATAMRQRLLSEAAVRFLRGDQAPLTMVLPHDWDPQDGGTFFGGLDAAWLDLTSVDGVGRAAVPEPVDGSTLSYPKWQEAAELDQPNFDSADALVRSGATLQNLLTLNNIVSGTVTDEALGTASYSARTRPIANRAAADASRAWIDSRLGQVHVSAPRAVTLSSSSGRFQATVTNDLDQPVTVSLEAPSDGKLTVDAPGRIAVPAKGRASLLVTARTHENGIHDVTLFVTDKRGTQLGGSTSLTIRSAQVSNVIWLFLGIGSALLFGAIGVRLFRRVRNARRTPAEEPGSEPGDGAEPSETKQPAGAGTR